MYKFVSQKTLDRMRDISKKQKQAYLDTINERCRRWRRKNATKVRSYNQAGNRKLRQDKAAVKQGQALMLGSQIGKVEE